MLRMHFDIIDTLYSLPGIVIGLTLHEYCHALAAYKLGDGTAKADGRLTFDPIKHIDPIGFLFIVIAGFGWAKPVSFDPRNLAHPRRDRVIIALAGPLSNLALGIVSLFIVKLFRLAGIHISSLPLFAVYKTVLRAPLYGDDQPRIVYLQYFAHPAARRQSRIFFGDEPQQRKRSALYAVGHFRFVRPHRSRAGDRHRLYSYRRLCQ